MFFCCCQTCVQFTDTFDRANAVTLGSPWTENGDWQISGNKAILNSPSPQNRARPSVSGTVCEVTLSGSDGDEIGLLVRYSASNNYEAVTLKFGTSPEIRWRMVTPPGPFDPPGDIVNDKVSTDLTLTAGGTYTLTIFYGGGGTGGGSYAAVDGVIKICRSDTLGGINWGLYYHGGSGTMTWEDFQIRNATCPETADCECPKCGGCCESGTGSQVELIMTGWPGDACCDRLNNTFILDDFCDNAVAIQSGGCTDYLIDLEHNSIGSSKDPCKIDLIVGQGGTLPAPLFRKVFDGQCVGVVHNLAFVSFGGIGGCDPSGVTATAEGLA